MAFVVGLPVNETQFSKTTILKNETFSHESMIILVNVNGTDKDRTGVFYKIIT